MIIRFILFLVCFSNMFNFSWSHKYGFLDFCAVFSWKVCDEVLKYMIFNALCFFICSDFLSRLRTNFASKMKEPVVVRKLRALQHKELVQFRKLMRKQLRNDDLLEVANHLVQLILDVKPKEQIFFEQIFQNDNHNASKKNILLNKLHEHLKQFIVKDLEFDGIHKQIHDEIRLLKFFNDRRLDEFVNKSREKIEGLLADYAYQDSHFFQYKLELARQLTLVGYRSRKRSNYRREFSDTIDLFYLYEKLANCAAMINEANVRKAEYDFGLMQEALEHLESRSHENIPTINLWGFALRLLIDPKDQENYHKLESGIYASFDLLSPITIRNFFTVLENSLRLMKGSISSYDKRLFQLYQYQMEKELLYIGGYFPALLLNNIVTVALRVKGAEWTANFIKENRERIPLDTRKETLVLNLSRCFFYAKKFDRCLGELGKIEKMKFKSIHLNLARRRLRVMAFYEIQVNGKESIPYQPERSIRALKKFLHEHKNQMSAAHERANLDFARFVNRLTELYTKKKKDKLFGEIESTGLLPEKDWLLKKVTDA